MQSELGNVHTTISLLYAGVCGARVLIHDKPLASSVSSFTVRVCMSVIKTSGAYAAAIARLLVAVADKGALSLSAGASECTSCSDNFNSPAGSTSAGSCFCDAGYVGSNDGTCMACVAGKYKMISGAGVYPSICPLFPLPLSLSPSLLPLSASYTCNYMASTAAVKASIHTRVCTERLRVYMQCR